MKKNLLFLLCVLSCSLFSLYSCKDDKEPEPEVPPTVEDIIAEYSAENLKPTIEGIDVDLTKVKVELAKSDASDKVTIILHNVVPETPVFKIPDAEFAATTRSTYISTLKGEATDNVSGYTVKVDGTVDNKVLTVKVAVTEIEAVNTNTTPLIGLVYKGDMNINVSNIPEPISMEQRVYITKASSKNMAQRDTSMVKLTIKNFTFQGLELGNITVDTILVQKRGEVFAFKAADRKIKVNQPIGEVNADLKGTIVGEKVNLSLDIEALGLKINVGFAGQTVVENQTAMITKISVAGDAVVGQDLSGRNFTLKVWDDIPDAQLLLTPQYELSENAKVDSAEIYIKGVKPNQKLTAEQISGKQPIDFSLLKLGKDSYLKYFLSPEDPNASTSYLMVYVERIPVITPVYDMQTWVTDAGNKKPTPKGLTNSNMAALFFPMLGISVDVPVVKATDGSAEITTSRTVSETNPSGMVPGVTAGTLFLGSFNLDPLNTLKSTHFGAPYKTKPINLKVTYKYTPGATFYKTVIDKEGNNGTEEVVGETDKCSINAYLYEVSNYDETLDGTNINTSKKVILKAVLADGTAKPDYVTETISFTEIGNGSFDSAKKYKLAIVCSSSKRGDEFMGAHGSKLWVKHLEVTK